jgi:hypothetical protein
MNQLARLLLIMPFGLLIAFGAGGIFLMMASVVSPAIGQMIFGAADAFLSAVFGMAMDGLDPTPVAQAAAWRGFQLFIAILVAPLLITAVAAELFRQSSWVLQMGLCGLLTMALPAALIGLNRLPSGAETGVLAGLFLTGAVAGGVYWMIAGRGAKPREAQPAPVNGPPSA